MHITVVEADVICLVEDGKSTFCESIMCGRCYCQVADGIPPGWRLADAMARWQMEWPLYYVIFSSGMSNRTSSPYMWQMVFAHISVEEWIIGSYVHSFLDCKENIFSRPEEAHSSE